MSSFSPPASLSLSYSPTQHQRCGQMLFLACDVCAKGSLVSPWYRGSWQPPSTRLWHRILAAPQTAGASAVQQPAWPCWERSSRRERGTFNSVNYSAVYMNTAAHANTQIHTFSGEFFLNLKCIWMMVNTSPIYFEMNKTTLILCLLKQSFELLFSQL